MEKEEMKKKKAGCPEQVVKRVVSVQVYCTKAEYFAIAEKASRACMKIPAYIRLVILKGQIKSCLTEEERMIASELVGMSNNLNQLTKACHQEGLLKAMVYFERYRNSIDDLLKKLKPCSAK